MGSPKNTSEDLADWIDALENLLLFNGSDSTKKILSERQIKI